jgi:L,D-transpeptidase ErfK/SrfK
MLKLITQLGLKLIVISFIFTCNLVRAVTYSQQFCAKPGYHCVRAQRGDTWESLWPNDEAREVVMRLNRMNTELQAGLTVAVPNDLLYLDHMAISPMPARIEPQGRRVVIISLTAEAFGAYDEYGTLLQWGPVSGGSTWCPDIGRGCRTPAGQYYVVAKGGPDCVSSKYPVGEGGAPMPFCMFFYKGYAMHASFLPGYHASHGCIRLFYDDAEWLNRDFIQTGKNATKVIIQSFNHLFPVMEYADLSLDQA